MVPVAQDIVSLLLPSFSNGVVNEPRYLYATLMELIVRPALSDAKLDFSIYTNLLPWLTSIADLSLHKAKHVRPNLLLIAFEKPSVELSEKTNSLMCQFINELLHTYAQPHQSGLKLLRICR